MKNEVYFTRKIRIVGNSLAIGIPPELISYLEIKEGDTLKLGGDKGKHGKFIWIAKEDEK